MAFWKLWATIRWATGSTLVEGFIIITSDLFMIYILLWYMLHCHGVGDFIVRFLRLDSELFTVSGYQRPSLLASVPHPQSQAIYVSRVQVSTCAHLRLAAHYFPSQSPGPHRNTPTKAWERTWSTRVYVLSFFFFLPDIDFNIFT